MCSLNHTQNHGIKHAFNQMFDCHHRHACCLSRHEHQNQSESMGWLLFVWSAIAVNCRLAPGQGTTVLNCMHGVDVVCVARQYNQVQAWGGCCLLLVGCYYLFGPALQSTAGPNLYCNMQRTVMTTCSVRAHIVAWRWMACYSTVLYCSSRCRMLCGCAATLTRLQSR